MSNRDHLVDGLHLILEALWSGDDQTAAVNFRVLTAWRARAMKSVIPEYRAGTFPAPVSQPAEDLHFLEAASSGMRDIEKAWTEGNRDVATQRVKDLLSYLSEQTPGRLLPRQALF
jgi:hypothetical protein